ncbi:HNH endonuclease family protein [Alloscardovia macacae]|uniref:Deoxyribonuclease n=1 Tax=Alloscardovia macacae TaxID=1160091 RepID=A0A261F6Q4_9BIFI|nr:deoxyribonuclease [Alloscardovia macacae]
MARRKRRKLSKAQQRWNTLVAAVVLLGVLVGYLLPYISSSVDRATGGYTASGQAADVLQTLQVVDDPQPLSRYNREYFGFRETDEDSNGCDAREDVLARDLTNVQFRAGSSCKVQSGTLADPYTGKTIHFQRGVQTSKAVQIDHVVALSNAWNSGAYKWKTDELRRFGNDPYNLLAVDGPANQEKSDAAADQWLPSNASFDCAYVARQIGVKAKYALSVTSAEKDAMLKVLHGCPAQAVPSS